MKCCNLLFNSSEKAHYNILHLQLLDGPWVWEADSWNIEWILYTVYHKSEYTPHISADI